MDPFIDAAGGVRLPRDPAAAHVVAPSGVNAIDLLEAPDLIEADLRAAAPGVHLRIGDCPRLSRVRLPAGSGAWLHIERQDDDALLTFVGPIAGFDGRLGGRSVVLPPEAGRCLGARIGADARDGEDAPELVVRFGPLALEAGAPGVPRASAGPRALLLVGGAAAILEEAGPVEVLCIVGAVFLEELTFAGAPRLLEIADAPRLARLAGSGGEARLRDCGSSRGAIEMEGEWDRVRLSSSPIARLRLAKSEGVPGSPRTTEVEVFDGARLAVFEGPPTARLTVHGRTRLESADGTLAVRLSPEALRRGLEAGLPARAALRAVLQDLDTQTDRRSPAAVARTLELLAELAAQGCDLDRVWTLRATLARRCVRANEPWRWPFDHLDLADRAWLADVAIWERCRESVPAARDFDAVVHASSSPRTLETLVHARAARVAAGQPHALIDDALFAVFAARPAPDETHGLGATPPRPTGRYAFSGVRATGRELGTRAGRMARLLLLTHAAPQGEALINAFAGWIAAVHAGDLRTLEVLARLWAHGVGAARTVLAQVATTAPRWTPPQRQVALRAALTVAPTV